MSITTVGANADTRGRKPKDAEQLTVSDLMDKDPLLCGHKFLKVRETLFL
jgi:hypothetical protein